jgi:predicted nucleic acid-binding protein
MILVDTSVLIDFFRGSKGEAVQKFRRALQQGMPFGINPLIFQEILQGSKTEEEYGILKKYLGTQRFYLPKDPIDSFAKAAKIYFDCRKQGITVRSTIDCLVAQTALENDLFLLHNDSDFDRIASVVDLKIYA